MPWLDHPTYRPVRDNLIKRLKSGLYFFKKLRPIAFVCGGKESQQRDTIAAYLRKNTDALVFFADDVWLQIAELAKASGKVNALEMEAELADLADIVIIVVESPGTFTELGAFALHEKLREKLLPILDLKHKDEPSFINTGPVRWIDQQSRFAPTIHTDFRVILGAAPALADRMRRIPPIKPALLKSIQVKESKKHLLFLLSDLVGIIGPATHAHRPRSGHVFLALFRK